MFSTPPAWIPDEAVTSCMGCRDSFTILRRRHHCRNCGQVFCGRCSSQSTPLPQFRLDRPVRVCNRCFVIIGHQNAADLYGTSPRLVSHLLGIKSPYGNFLEGKYWRGSFVWAKVMCFYLFFKDAK